MRAVGQCSCLYSKEMFSSIRELSVTQVVWMRFALFVLSRNALCSALWILQRFGYISVNALKTCDGEGTQQSTGVDNDALCGRVNEARQVLAELIAKDGKRGYSRYMS
jgi:hypothetical protein